MNKTKLILAISSLFVASAFTAQAQTQTQTQYRTDAPRYNAGAYGPEQGDWELTLGGSGASNNDFDDSFGGINFSVGHFISDALEVSVRQSLNYSNGPGGGSEWDGSTFVALDYHFGVDNLRPFVGVNFGGLYGENTSDTWAAGVEAGLKLYVQPKTFVFALVNYAWTFNDSDGVTDNFDDGAILWSLGVGFNF